MSALPAIAVWAFVVAATGIFVELAVVVSAIVRQALRIKVRLAAMQRLAAEQTAQANGVAARLNTAAEAVPVLAERTTAALATIRGVVPPSLVPALRAVSASLRLLRRAIDH